MPGAGAGGLYILKSINNFFLVRVEEEEDDGSVDVKVVPAKFNNEDNVAALQQGAYSFPFGRECLHISYPGSGRPILSQLDYFKNCSFGEAMDRKTGTYHMVCATLSFCARLFGRTFTKFGVQDGANFYCGGRMVKMWLHNLLVYGETYYERKFGGKPESSYWQSDEKIEAWGATKTKLATELVKRDLVDILITLTERDHNLASLANELRGIMDTCVERFTWKDMFHMLHSAHEGEGCKFFSRDTLRKIQQYFEIEQIDTFEIEVTARHHVSLVAHEKVLDGAELLMVTTEDLENHQA